MPSNRAAKHNAPAVRPRPRRTERRSAREPAKEDAVAADAPKIDKSEPFVDNAATVRKGSVEGRLCAASDAATAGAIILGATIHISSIGCGSSRSVGVVGEGAGEHDARGARRRCDGERWPQLPRHGVGREDNLLRPQRRAISCSNDKVTSAILIISRGQPQRLCDGCLVGRRRRIGLLRSFLKRSQQCGQIAVLFEGCWRQRLSFTVHNSRFFINRNRSIIAAAASIPLPVSIHPICSFFL